MTIIPIMKNKIKITALLIAMFAFTATINAQSTEKKPTPPSDALSGFTYDFDKAQSLII